ncbi:MAG TPA: amino acid ABC transporter substrate-binding protein [Anaerolineales bacterium]|nr:amino acid ABC transporter substrate-binding protein [Anaerolineales bacterium]
MKRVFASLSALLIAAMLLAACAQATPAPTEAPAAPTEAPAAPTEAPAAPTEAPPAEPIKIGASLPLTGDFSEPGTAAQMGYELWVEQVNNAGGLLGRQVEFTVYDNASDPDTAVADYERLITQDKVDLVVGPFSSRLVIPTSEVAAKYGYAFPEPAGGAPGVFDRGLTNIFFAQPAPGADQAIPFADYILGLPEDVRPKTFAVVSMDDPFNLGVVEAAETLLTAGGLTSVLKEIYPPDTKDFSSIAAKVADLDPDLILGGTIFEDTVGQIQAYVLAGYQPRGAFFTTGPSLPKEFREALGTATEGVFSAISWFEASATETNPEFVAAFHEKFGADPIAEDSANAYTVGQILQQAVENTQSIDNAKLIDEMHSATFKTVVGPLSFDEVGRPQGSFMILQWRGEGYLIVYPDFAKQADPIWPKPEW